MHPAFVARSKSALPIWFVTPANFAKVCDGLNKSARAFVKASGFEPRAGQHLLLPAPTGTGGVLFGIERGKDNANPFLPGTLAGLLPAGTYRFANAPHD